MKKQQIRYCKYKGTLSLLVLLKLPTVESVVGRHSTLCSPFDLNRVWPVIGPSDANLILWDEACGSKLDPSTR